jgi:hypothetical protein
LIDQDEASAKANSRLEKVNEEWTKARSLAENTTNDDDAREFAKDLVTKIGPTRVKLHENEHVLLITDLPPASANVLLASFPDNRERPSHVRSRSREDAFAGKTGSRRLQ